ncbi:MAG: hypothetical protein ACPGVO_07820 [Spirulinaceae cyanobacterium]
MQLANALRVLTLSVCLHFVGISTVFSSIGLAQTDLRGECRQTNKDLVVREARSSQSSEVLSVRQHEFLYINEVDSLGGWVAIRWPVRGFAPSQDLAPNCNSFPRTPTEFCVNNQVRGVDFFRIYSASNRTSEIEDVVYPGERIHVLGEPLINRLESSRWLRVDHPVEGWVEYDSSNIGIRNFVPCDA